MRKTHELSFSKFVSRLLKRSWVCVDQRAIRHGFAGRIVAAARSWRSILLAKRTELNFIDVHQKALGGQRRANLQQGRSSGRDQNSLAIGFGPRLMALFTVRRAPHTGFETHESRDSRSLT